MIIFKKFGNAGPQPSPDAVVVLLLIADCRALLIVSTAQYTKMVAFNANSYAKL